LNSINILCITLYLFGTIDMAIKIEIPGVGEVSVEGAAQEDTMQAILAAVSKSDKSKQAEEKKLKKANEDAAKAMSKVKTGLEDLEDELASAADEAKSSSGRGAKAVDELADASKQTVKNLGGFAATLALTATSVAVGFAKNFNDNAANPIAVGAALLNTSIDLLGAGLKIGVEAVSAFGGALVGAIPLIGGGLQRGVDGMAAVAKEVIDLSTTVLKAGNEMMSAEFQMTTKVMADFAKSGASFAGGMTEMRQVANESGIGIEQFGKVISSSRESIVGMGLSVTEATHKLSRGMGALTTTFGKSGVKLRDEMLALGYSYEQQGELMASYAANQRTAGRLKNMTDTELAQGTAQYAKDLKVLADITGKDAKKAMEDAQAASLQSDIMAQLKPEEKEKFIKAYAAMPDYAKKGFLQYVSSGGQAISDATTNVIMNQNSKVEDLIKGTFDSVKDSSKSATQVQNETLKRASAAGESQRALNASQGNAIAYANQMAGGLSEFATAMNQVSASALYNADAVDASATATEKNAQTQDPVTKGFVKATDAVVAFQMKMANLATELMPLYATAIGDATAKTATIVTAAMQLASGKITMKQFGDMMGMPGADGTAKKTKIDRLKEEREKNEDALAESQAKLPSGRGLLSKAAGTDFSVADTYAGPEVAAEIKARKEALKKSEELEEKVNAAKLAYTHGLQDVLGSLRDHATEEDKQAATLKFNQEFIKKSQAEDPTSKANMLETKRYNPVNIKGTAEYFALPTAKPTTPDATTGVPTPNTAKETGQAKGGVSVGPTSGYHELLHGTEAVVPLPDNKSIPVKLDSSSLNATLHEHTGILNNILLAMNKNNTLSSGILQNSY
jgi:hypothetical protein